MHKRHLVQCIWRAQPTPQAYRPTRLRSVSDEHLQLKVKHLFDRLPWLIAACESASRFDKEEFARTGLILTALCILPLALVFSFSG